MQVYGDALKSIPLQVSTLALTLGVGCTGVNQWGPLQVSTLTLGVVIPLTFSIHEFEVFE